MKKRKMLSILLSLALVLGMGVAFTVLSGAETPDGVYTPVTPDTVEINGYDVDKGEYFYGSLTGGTTTPPPSGVTDGYVYYNEKTGHLELHDFVITSREGYYPIYAYEENTLYIDLFGDSEIKTEEYDSYNPEGIYAEDVYLVIEAKEAGATLGIASCGSGIGAGGVEIISGDITIDLEYPYDDDFAAIYSEKTDILIKGGSVHVIDAYYGLYANEELVIDGGTVTIDESGYGLNADFVYINGKGTGSPKVAVKSYYGGVYGNDGFEMTGGTLDVDLDCESYNAYGIKTCYGHVNITGGQIDIDIDAESDYVYGIYSEYGDVNITGGQIDIDIDGESDDDCCGICAGDGDVTITGGGVDIDVNSALSEYYSKGICAYDGNVNIKGGKIDIDVSNEEDYGIGIYTGYNDINITGGQTDIDADGYGLVAYGDILIKNAKADIYTELYDSVWATGTITVDNSDVKVWCDSEEKGYTAFNKSPSIIGNSVVKAGSLESNAKMVSPKSDLKEYQFVHIYPDTVKAAAGIIATVNKIFTGMSAWFNPGSWFNGFFGSFFKAPIWNSFFPFFKWF